MCKTAWVTVMLFLIAMDFRRGAVQPEYGLTKVWIGGHSFYYTTLSGCGAFIVVDVYFATGHNTHQLKLGKIIPELHLRPQII